MNKLAHGGAYPGREDDEAAILAFCNIQKAAALPHTRQHVSGVPPRAPPVASHDFAVPAVAASAGVAPLASTTEEVDVPPVAPLAPETREEPVAALAAATEMEDMDLPDANLAEAIAESERRDTDLDAPRAPRKRRAVTHDDSDTPSQTSEGARPRKKATRASRTSTTESGLTLAGSSRSTAAQKSTKTTRRPTRSPAASRQPDEDGRTINFRHPKFGAGGACDAATDRAVHGFARGGGNSRAHAGGRRLVLRRDRLPMLHGSRLVRSGRNRPPQWRRPPQRPPPPPWPPTQLSSDRSCGR
ncbi:uncharacterized protein LOC124724862 [Schistocerca piceifrons]|uniref:uncharacterized protein LOC124724862 n=1 Tax=Schistocerca piceifrons TaxID=274613 RepID=UPI001F5FC6F1|nr:uncharacterized protein LOC124724862 [Schistocerca piceifrons]